MLTVTENNSRRWWTGTNHEAFSRFNQPPGQRQVPASRSSLQKSFLKRIFILLQILDQFLDIFHTWSQTILIENFRMICLGLSALPFWPSLYTISMVFCSCSSERGTTLDSILLTYSLVFSPSLLGTPFSRSDCLRLYLACSKHD